MQNILKFCRYNLCHTYAARYFETGVAIKAISKQLGDTNVRITYHIYAYLPKNTKIKELDKPDVIGKLTAWANTLSYRASRLNL